MIELSDRLRIALDHDTEHIGVDPALIAGAVRRGRRRHWRVRGALVAAPVLTLGAIAVALSTPDESTKSVLSTMPTSSGSPTPTRPIGSVEVDGVRLPIPEGFRLVSVGRTAQRPEGGRRTRALFAPPEITDAEAGADSYGCVSVAVLRDGPVGTSDGRTRQSEYVGANGRRGPLWFSFISVSPSVVLEILGMASPADLDLRRFADGAVDTGRPGAGPVDTYPTSGELG